MYIFNNRVPAKKYIQLKMFIFKKEGNKFKQTFHECKNFSLSSIASTN